MGKENWVIRKMEKEDIQIAVDWAAEEGWNPGLFDAECFYAADPEGFFMGLLENQPVACVSAVRYGTSFGFLGFFIVRPEFRARGFGLRLGMAGLKHLEGRNVGLDGVIQQQENYQRSGFKIAYRNIRYEGVGLENGAKDSGLIELKKINFKILTAYDDRLFPGPRHGFLRAWLRQPGCVALCILEEQALKGYGVLRPCRAGFKIGPLFAETPEGAEKIYRGLVAGVPRNVPVFLDVPEVHHEAVVLAERYHMKKVFETARMYSKESPAIPLEQWFGVTSFELG